MKTNFFLTILLLSLSFQAFSEENTVENKLSVTYEDSKTISHGKYIGGGVASVLLGWGVGHAIQGRYSEKGWIFTAGGALMTLGFVALGSNFKYIIVYYLFSFLGDMFLSEEDRYADGLPGVIYLYLGATFVGLSLKVWEIVDAWVLPPHYKVVKESPFEIKPLAFYDPNTKLNYGLSFKYKF